MAAITTPILAQTPQLRPLNILRDLPGVADLVEKCFADTMDSEGRRYLQQMRRAGQDNVFMRWAANAAESVSMPLIRLRLGGEWRNHRQRQPDPLPAQEEENLFDRQCGRPPGLPAQGHRARPDSRGHAPCTAQRHAAATWLHVRDDNPGAIALYLSLGFQELARRTLWQAKPDRNACHGRAGHRNYQAFRTRLASAGKLAPAHLSGADDLVPTHALAKPASRPGPFIYRFMMDYEVRHWVARTDNGALSAILSWQAMAGKNDRLWASVPPQGSERALTALLLHARRNLPWRQTLTLDYPAGEYNAAMEAAGFHPHRTLLWMKLRAENPVHPS